MPMDTLDAFDAPQQKDLSPQQQQQPQSPVDSCSISAAEAYLDRVRQRQVAREDKENEEPTTETRRPRTKATELEKRNAAKTASVSSSSSAAVSPSAKRKRTSVASYNENALKKADAKAKKAAYLAEVARYARENRIRKGDYEVKAVEGMKFCRQDGCKYCRDFGLRMPLWLISYVGYGTDGSTYEHWDKLDCPELVMASVFLRMGVDPRNERACMRWYNFGLLDSDDEDDMEELEEEPEPELYSNPREYDWMRLGAPADHVAPAAADENDLDNVVIVALNKKTGGPFLDKNGVALEAIVLTPQNVTDMKADFALHRAVGKARITNALMDEHHWTPRIKAGGPLKGVRAQVTKQLTDLGFFD